LLGIHNVAQSTAPSANTYDGSGFRSGAVGALDEYAFQFVAAGTYYYVCEAHAAMGMKGVVIVQDPSPVPSPTWTADSAGPPIAKALPAQNPNPTALAVQLKRGVDKLTLKIYSAAMAVVAQQELGSCGPGWQTLPLPAAFLAQAPNGTYYFVVVAQSASGSSRINGLGSLVILR